MDDFWGERRSDPFFDDVFPQFNNRRRTFDSPLSVLHNSMQQMHREMDEMMRQTFGSFGLHHFPYSQPPFHSRRPAVGPNRDQDLDKQVQQYGVDSIFDDDYTSDWDFVKRLEQLEKQPKPLQPNAANDNQVRFYGRSHMYNYNSTGDGKVEERKVIQDTRGNRMESIQRKLGDQIWARTTKQNDRGEIDEDEKLFNMQENDKERFMNEWRSLNAGVSPPYRNQIDSKLSPIDVRPDIEVEKINDPKQQYDLPSLAPKSEGSWLGKLKFW